MPKVVISSDKGLVQKTGSTVLEQITNKNSNDETFGKYTYVREIDFVRGGASGGAYTATNTEDGLIARLCNFPSAAVILNASVQITEAFAGGLESTAIISLGQDPDTNVASGTDVTGEVDIVASIDVSGAAGSVIGVVQAAAGTAIAAGQELALYNNGTGNTTGACTSGKLLFIMECISASAPEDLAQKF